MRITETSHLEPEFVCTIDECGQTFSMESILFNHIKTSHDCPVVSVEIGNKGIARKCKSRHKVSPMKLQSVDRIDTKISKKSNLDEHIERSDTVQDLVCQPYLIEHTNDVHNKEEEHSCQQSCSQSNSNDEMKGHYNRYTTVKSLDCAECGKKFATNHSLKQHMNGVHNNIKPNVCPEPECEFRTAYKSNWKFHSKYHGNSRTKFTCHWPGCSYTAVYKSTLRQHRHSYR